MFGFGKKSPEDELNDAALIRAARKRLLREIEGQAAKEAASQKIINNVYGGGGVMDRLGGGGPPPPASADGEDPYDYFVDITRKDLDELNPHTGKPAGWEKKVHRYRHEKKKAR